MSFYIVGYLLFELLMVVKISHTINVEH